MTDKRRAAARSAARAARETAAREARFWRAGGLSICLFLLVAAAIS